MEILDDKALPSPANFVGPELHLGEVLLVAVGLDEIDDLDGVIVGVAEVEFGWWGDDA